MARREESPRGRLWGGPGDRRSGPEDPRKCISDDTLLLGQHSGVAGDGQGNQPRSRRVGRSQEGGKGSSSRLLGRPGLAISTSWRRNQPQAFGAVSGRWKPRSETQGQSRVGGQQVLGAATFGDLHEPERKPARGILGASFVPAAGQQQPQPCWKDLTAAHRGNRSPRACANASDASRRWSKYRRSSVSTRSRRS